LQTVLGLVYGMGLVLTGDEIREQDNALIILNHPTRLQIVLWIKIIKDLKLNCIRTSRVRIRI
jgi:hypothetical protein